MPKRIAIAIDGYSSCGKSTLAKMLAKSIGYSYVDTGAMYRCVTLYALENGLINHHHIDREALINRLEHISIEFRQLPGSNTSQSFLNGVNVEETIRGMHISNNVSAVSVIKEVRERLVEMQRQMGREKGVVMEGRDIGTVVLPEAELKIFMTASVEVRARRRFDEMQAAGMLVTLDEVMQNVLSRDKTDTQRKESPLVQATDAVVLDNSTMTREEQLDFMLSLVAEKAGR